MIVIVASLSWSSRNLAICPLLKNGYGETGTKFYAEKTFFFGLEKYEIPSWDFIGVSNLGLKKKFDDISDLFKK